jgi:hypothetical protein
MPPLPTLEKGITKPAEKLLIIFGNASAHISEPAVITPLSNGHQDATNTTVLADPSTKECDIIQLEEKVEESFYYKKIDSSSRLRHARSNSMDHLCSPCTNKSSVFVKKTVSSSVEFLDSFSTHEGDASRLCFSFGRHRSPQSVLDAFGAEDTAELCSSFHSL